LFEQQDRKLIWKQNRAAVLASPLISDEDVFIEEASCFRKLNLILKNNMEFY
jgi:hypothetical protein